MRLLKITRSNLHSAYVLNISQDDGTTWEVYDRYVYGGVPTDYNWEYDEDSVSVDILSDIAKLVNDGYMFATSVINVID